MSVLAKGPKRIVPKNEIGAQFEDPEISRMLAGVKPECAPVSAATRERELKEAERRARERQIDSKNNGTSGTWAFVKNGFHKEEIVFKDGTSFRFPSVIFVTEDKEMADKILEVAASYNIVLK